MTTTNHSRYPYHLANLVVRELTEIGEIPPPHKILLKLFEILYFASLKTDESRQCRCTVNLLSPTAYDPDSSVNRSECDWSIIKFDQPIKMDVRSFLKISEAADPAVASLAIHYDSEELLWIWAMVDQEIRYGDHVALDAKEDPSRPGLIQATINGVGAISVYKNFRLLGSLEQNLLITEYYDVLWKGPIHDRLKENVGHFLRQKLSTEESVNLGSLVQNFKSELLVRWQNSLCRILHNIQRYGHGGGLLIRPFQNMTDLNIKYRVFYDRLPDTLFRLCKHQIIKRENLKAIAQTHESSEDFIDFELHTKAVDLQTKLDRLKSELLGCNRFIASLSKVDGFILLDQSMTLRGFGVETRADEHVSEISLAGDALATPRLFRKFTIDHFGTRHRSMIRYCDQHPDAVGFVVSQDGDIRALIRHTDRLVLWENINVQLAYRPEAKER